jgi:hypothetical protein
MKNFLYDSRIAIVFTVIVWVIYAFTVIDENKKNIASVDQVEGVYVFMFSNPVAPYDYLGTVKKSGIEMSGQPDERFKALLKHCKKDYPQAEAIIIQDADMKKADAIRFK